MSCFALSKPYHSTSEQFICFICKFVKLLKIGYILSLYGLPTTLFNWVYLYVFYLKLRVTEFPLFTITSKPSLMQKKYTK